MASSLDEFDAIFPKWKAQIEGSTRGDHKQPGKRQQNSPVRLRRIGFGDRLLIASKESLSLALLKWIEERAKTGSLQPFDDGMRAGECMKVGRAPDVDVVRMWTQQAEIAVRGRPLG